jgi:hypothetical protein
VFINTSQIEGVNTQARARDTPAALYGGLLTPHVARVWPRLLRGSAFQKSRNLEISDPKLPVRKSVDLHSPSAVGAEYHLRLPCFQLLLQAVNLSKLLFSQLHPPFGGSLCPRTYIHHLVVHCVLLFTSVWYCHTTFDSPSWCPQWEVP